MKAKGKLVDFLDDVFTNPWRKDTAFQNLTTGVEETTEDLIQAKSKVKQEMKDFVVKRCSSSPTSDYFDPLKETKLKSFKDLKVVRKVPNKLILPLRDES